MAQGRSLTEQVLPPEVPAVRRPNCSSVGPDLVQAEQELAAATARSGVAKADRFPKPSITGIPGVASLQFPGGSPTRRYLV